ncbi:Transcription factor LHW [Quillaja saponaria]|uniref:Transcription factor LHW n=1 Tax=Quillaja saponaria TaxID=32244 RepID=A0AAD7KY60_QUISA|nr:Transcription factor LHW [Quillaja saponaria]
MGFLLKEVLKTLCDSNQWSYAVFWKIGCQNPKLLIWEECHYEPSSYSFPQRIAGIGTYNPHFEGWEGCWIASESQSSPLGIQEGNRIGSLIDKMMMNNQVNVVGEGIVGRAAFTGNHQWILLNNCSRDGHPTEVFGEVHHQFLAGMQTVAVIPVASHGVVQLGSTLEVAENMGFVNDVKSLILQLGRVPGALLSEHYAAEVSVPGTPGLPLPMDLSDICKVTTSTPLVADGSNHQSSIIRSSGQPAHSLIKEINNHQSSDLIYQTPSLTQILPKTHDNLCEPKATSAVKPNFTHLLENGVVGAEVILSNFDAWLEQNSASYNSRSFINNLSGIGHSGASPCSIKLQEKQILSGLGDPGLDNINKSASKVLNMSQLRRNGDSILNHHQGSVNTPLVRKRKSCGRMANLRPNLIRDPSRLAFLNISGTHKSGIRLQNDSSPKLDGLAIPNMTGQSSASHMLSEGSGQKHLSTNLKNGQNELASAEQRIDNDLLQALNIPDFPSVENVLSDIPGFLPDFPNSEKRFQTSKAINTRKEDSYAPPPSGDDLFDVLGVDFKNKLLSGNWNKLVANEPDGKPQNLGGCISAFTNMQDMDPDCYSVTAAISDSDVFSGMGMDHLLDAVVSRAQSAVKQTSDDNVSCKTTLTRISSSSIPSGSPMYRQFSGSDRVQELFGIAKTGGKAATAETSSLRSQCKKNDAGTSSDATSLYGSRLSSWVEQGSNVKHESSASTAYSKRPDEICKSNRKRLKPGENPRPRPKDRQMIQDRVKELREIVPNGEKCSIDALLECTIKHMLFLQSVTEHADKLKQTGESKIISKEGGLLLKDNFEGGATWAYEVGSQSMACPIVVEDLNPPRQMQVEMLCEERGFFLEIADLIRGLGLTILKGVMESRNDKIWARFAVELLFEIFTGKQRCNKDGDIYVTSSTFGANWERQCIFIKCN